MTSRLNSKVAIIRDGLVFRLRVTKPDGFYEYFRKPFMSAEEARVYYRDHLEYNPDEPLWMDTEAWDEDYI